MEQVEPKKQFAINISAKIIGFIVNVGISFFLTPFIIEKVGSEAYGFIGLANNFVGYVQIITVALNSMASRFITIKIYQNDKAGANQYFTSVVFANIFLAVVLIVPSTIIALLLDKIVNISVSILPDVQILWTFIFLNFIISIISATYSVAVFAKNRLYLSSVREILANLLKVVLLLLAFSFLRPYVWYLGFAYFISTAYSFIWNIKYTRRLLPEIRVRSSNFNIHAIKELISSGIWNSFSKLGSMMSTGLDLLIANLFVGATDMGVLSISKTVPSAILALIGTMASVFSPSLTISYARGNYSNMREQIIYSMKLLGIFSSIPVSILFAYGDIFYGLWVPSQDEKLLYLLSIISCFEFIFVLPLEGLWNIFTVTNKVKRSSTYLFFNSLLTIIIVLIALQFTESINAKLYIIAGTSTVFGVIRATTFLPIYGAHCLNLKWNTFYPTIVLNTISVVIVTFTSFLIRHFLNINSWIILVLAAALTCVFALFFNIIIVLNKSERNRIKDMIFEKLRRERGGNYE